MTNENKLYNEDKVPLIKVENADVVWGKRYQVDSATLGDDWKKFDTALLGFNHTGLIELLTQNKSLVISPGIMTYIPAHIIHQQKAMGDQVSGWFVSVPATLTKHLPSEICTFQPSTILMSLIQQICAFQNGSARNETEQIVLESFKNEIAQVKLATPLFLPMPRIPSLRKVAHTIINEPEDMNGLDHWAKVAAMSRRSFTRHFNKETGLSFVLWRQLAKVYSAVHQLSQGKTVKEVSANLGYKDSSTFIALFRKKFGTSPKKYFYSEQLKAQDAMVIGKPSSSMQISKKKFIFVLGLICESLFRQLPPIENADVFSLFF